jgi:hypothetical protein
VKSARYAWQHDLTSEVQSTLEVDLSQALVLSDSIAARSDGSGLGDSFEPVARLGVRDLPRRIPIYRLIWRDLCRTQAGDGA